MEKKGRESFFKRFGRGSKLEADRKLKAKEGQVLASQSITRTESPLTRGAETSQPGSSTIIDDATPGVRLSADDTNNGAVPITGTPAQLAPTKAEQTVAKLGCADGKNVNEGLIYS
jgi:hypothetical protein